MNRTTRTFMCDFETTVYDGQKDTEVWASAIVELYTEDVLILHSIKETFDYIKTLDCNVTMYYHNLKFDGAFWLSYLLVELGFKQALVHNSNNELDVSWKHEKEMENHEVKFVVSDRGQWYQIIFKENDHYFMIKDSLKLLPFSVKEIGKSFGTKHKKLEMEYKGYRYAGCKITEEEKKYIANDVLVVKEALESMFDDGHKRLTIGSCCLSEFKKLHKYGVLNYMKYEDVYPDLESIPLSEEYGSTNVDAYIRKSYKGGWCYLVKGKENKIKRNGVTADVNSLYPSMMHSESGNKYPIGNPKFWRGNYIPDMALKDHIYYFVRIKTRFYLKDGYLPFIQIKGNPLYIGTEALESSDVYDVKTGEYYTHYMNPFTHKMTDTRVELTLTQTDYELLKEHYELVDFEILDGCFFFTACGLFDEYIDKYKEMKLKSTGAKRTEAKLFLNNLYGKMASSSDSSFKIAYIKDDGVLSFIPITEHKKKTGYIPIGSAITSYARNFTIRAAQENFHGVNKRGFIYADTDSIHCDLHPEELKGIKVHDKNFCCWKLESSWDVGYFTRQKTYIEHVIAEDLKTIEKPYYNIKCAGMPQKCKDLFDLSMSNTLKKEDKINYNKEEQEFLFNKETGEPIKRTIADFKNGLKIPGKLLPKRIKGGILLTDTYYEMRG